MLSEYEIIVIIRADLEESDIMETYGRVCANVADIGGHVLDKEDWGRRKLAYPIRKFSYGRYMMAVVLLAPKDVTEIERRMRFDDRVVRFLVVCTGPVADPTARIEAAEDRRK
ncbi:MAG TPA: 30S ribosomal protein S6, partial [Myxococcota bacterium]|nr:30S ribosomal protein S6 [Myxococcota bacterium]